jgi:hypothetical protein
VQKASGSVDRDKGTKKVSHARKYFFTSHSLDRLYLRISKVNTDGKIENKGFTIWGTWNMSGNDFAGGDIVFVCVCV